MEFSADYIQDRLIIFMEDLFTIIIPSKRLCNLTLRCINGIRKYYLAVKIILLFDEHPGIISTLRKEIIILPGESIGEKRNKGVELAQTPYVAFIDSDAVPFQGWLENALPYLEDDEIGAVAGPSLPFLDQDTQQEMSYMATLSYLVSNITYEKTNFDGFVSRASSCNLLTSKALYRSLKGMNPRFLIGEDTDFCAKVIRMGKKIYFSSKVKIFHRNRRFLGFVKQRIVYGFLGFERSHCYKRLMPFAFQVLLLVLTMDFFVFKSFQLISVILIIYALAILFESFRISRSLKKVIPLALYIFIGNFFPGIWNMVFSFSSRV